MKDTITKIQPSDLISDSMVKINHNFEIISNRDDVTESKLNQWAERIENQLADIQNDNGIISDTLLNNVQKLENKINNITNLDGIAKEVQNIVNNASTDVEKLINDKAGEAISSRLGDYVKTSTLNKTLGGYVSSTAFDTYRSDSSKSSAQSSRIVANSKFLKLPNGDIDCLVRISGEITEFKSVEDYFKSLSASEKATILGDKTFSSDDKALEDPDVVAKLIEVCERTFKTIVSEMSVISQEVGDGFAESSIISTVNKNGKAIVSSIFVAANDKGSEIALNADNINIDGKHALTVKSDGNINIESGGNINIENGGDFIISSGGKFQIESGNFNIGSDGTVIVKGAIEATSLTIQESGKSNSIKDFVKSVGNDMNWGNLPKWIDNAIKDGSTTITGGLVLTGNILAKDSDDNITAGMIGSNNTENDIRFFAGSNMSDINNAPFRVYSDGRLVATRSEIEGDIIASAFKSIYNESSGLTRYTELNAQSFIISVTGSVKDEGDSDVDVTGNSVYIKIVDKLKDEDGTIVSSGENLYGVPVLCMKYNNIEYVLSPASWIRGEESNVYERNMTWVNAYDVHNWTVYSNEFDKYPQYCYSGSLLDSSNNVGTYYVFNQDNKSHFITGDSNKDKLYQFSIVDLNQKDIDYNSLLNMMVSYNLINNTSAKRGSITLRSKIKQESDLGRTTIDVSNCERFKGYLQSSINTAAVGSWSFTANSETINNFNFRSALKTIKGILLGKNGTIYNWYQNNTVVSVPNTYKLTPFMSDEGSNPDSGIYPTEDYNTKDDKIEIKIDYYPLFTITDMGKTINNSTNTILLKLTYTTTCTYNGTSFVVNNQNIIPQSGNFEFEFYSVFSVEQPIIFDLNNISSVLHNTVFTFITDHLKDITCENFNSNEFTFNGNVTCTNSYDNLTIHS